MLFCFVLREKIKMFLIQFNNFCIAKKSKLSTVPRFCTHFYRNTVVLENKLLVFNISTTDNHWSKKLDTNYTYWKQIHLQPAQVEYGSTEHWLREDTVW